MIAADDMRGFYGNDSWDFSTAIKAGGMKLESNCLQMILYTSTQMIHRVLQGKYKYIFCAGLTHTDIQYVYF